MDENKESPTLGDQQSEPHHTQFIADEADELFAPLPGIAIEEAVPDMPDDYVEIIFRHSRAASFTVGGFQFKDHLLRLVGPREQIVKKRAEFARLIEGLLPIDRSSITQLRTQPTTFEHMSRRVSGIVDTASVADKQAGHAPKSNAPAPGKSGLNFKF